MLILNIGHNHIVMSFRLGLFVSDCPLRIFYTECYSFCSFIPSMMLGEW